MKVSIIGLGYIGLPTAALIAKKGLDVQGIDINNSIIQTINTGKSPIVEFGLEDLISSTVSSGKLIASKDIVKSDVFVITVQTPLAQNNQPDMTFVSQVIQSIAPLIEKGNLIILESTSPVGATELISDELRNLRKDLSFPHYKSTKDHDVNIAYCPERVLPGNTLEELQTNDRILGGMTKQCAIKAQNFYNQFVQAECLLTDSRTAEICKLTENSYRDVNIAFSNEISMICEENSIDIWELISLANRHPRVEMLQPGPGVGGHCLPIDPWFIVSTNPDSAELIKTARSVNDKKTSFVVNQIESSLKNNELSFEEISICLLGISYKANSDDLRESPSLDILKKLTKFKFKNINVVEPNANFLPEKESFQNINLLDLKEGIESSDVIVSLVDHREFKGIDKKTLEDKILLDTIGIFNS